MPPLPAWYQGREAITAFLATARCRGAGATSSRTPTASPRSAATSGTRRAATHHGWVIDVLTLDGPRIAEVTSFIGPEDFARFGLPAALP